jgi:hypothetical protein
MGSQAFTPVGSQLTTGGSAGVVEEEGAGVGVGAGSAEPEPEPDEPDEPDEPGPDEPGAAPPLEPDVLHCCCSLQLKPAPQSASATHGRAQRGRHSLPVVVVQLASLFVCSGQEPSVQAGAGVVASPLQLVCATSAHAMPSAQSESALHGPGRHTETI